MEFYQISCPSGGRYELLEEDGSALSVQLSNDQLGRLADRLSALYWQQETLPLRIRIYLTAYYSQGQTEYISVKSTPSLLLSEARLFGQYGLGVSLDGFALTFLEGEEENRVWIGEDGAVENRGASTEKVRKLLEVLVESLNEPPAKLVPLASVQGAFSRDIRLLLLQKWSDKAFFTPLLDLNQEAVSWCWVLKDAVWQSLALAELSAETLWDEVRLPLLAKGAHYELSLTSQEIGLRQYCYSWEQEQMAEGLWQALKDLLAEGGIPG